MRENNKLKSTEKNEGNSQKLKACGRFFVQCSLGNKNYLTTRIHRLFLRLYKIKSFNNCKKLDPYQEIFSKALVLNIQAERLSLLIQFWAIAKKDRLNIVLLFVTERLILCTKQQILN